MTRRNCYAPSRGTVVQQSHQLDYNIDPNNCPL
jgi:hypothetical protein